jgi:urea transport system ATP-binding protein
MSGLKEGANRKLLSAEKLSVNFSGFYAIRNVDFSVEAGELRVVIGPNGAGKTTLMDLITGKTRPTQGKVFFDGRNVTGLSPSVVSHKHRIGRKFQGPNVFDNLSAEENVEIALHGHNTVLRSLVYRRNAEAEARIREILLETGLLEKRGMDAALLSHGERQWLEIGMTIAQRPKLLILDEPTAGMTAAETRKTGEIIRALKGRMTIIVVEHDMDFVRQVAERVTVLHRGEVLADGSFAEIEKNPEVIRVYLKDDEEEARNAG